MVDPSLPRSRQVLLVEDNPDEEDLTLRALREAGFDRGITVIRDGEEALEWIRGIGRHASRAGTPPPDLVLLDAKLPRVDGLEVLRGLRAFGRTRHVPVVIFTSSDDDRELARCYELGANACVRKPVEFPEFRRVVAALGTFWIGTNEPPPPPPRERGRE